MRSKSRLFATAALSTLPFSAFAEDFVNTGDIVTSGNGMEASDPASSHSFTNSGSITAGETGIYTSGTDDVSVLNSGEITSGEIGITLVSATTAHIQNDGQISAGSAGIYLAAPFIRSDDDAIEYNYSVTNTGTITGQIAVLDGRNNGFNQAGYVHINNEGSITSSSDSGIFLSHLIGTTSITNSGSITTSNTDCIGAAARCRGVGLNSTAHIEILNSGLISGASGLASVESFGTNIYNSGTINGTQIGIEFKQTEEGVYDFADCTTFYHTGELICFGELPEHDETINHIVNSGTISGGEYAIWSDYDLSLTLLPGSVIDGVIYNEDPSQTSLTFGDGLITSVEFEGGVPTDITVAEGNTYTTTETHVYVLDGDVADVVKGLAPQLGQLTNLLEFRTPSAPEVSRGAAGGGAWGDATVSGFRDDGLSGYALTGLMGWEMASGQGVMLGGGLSRSEARSTVGTELDTKYLVGGLYGTWGAADYAVFGGLSRTDATQIISGSEETASYTSLFLAPSLSFDGQIGTADTNLRLTYAVQKSGSHSYGTALTVDDQINHLVDVKASAAYDIGNGFQAYYGANGRYGAGNAVDVLFDDVALTTDSTSEFSARGFVGLKNDMFDLELGRDTNGRNDLRLTVSVAF